MKIPLRYPHSFALFLLLAFLLVVLPLIGGLLNTASILSRLTREAHRSISTTVTVTRTARQLVDGVDALQRTAVQSYVLEEPKLQKALVDAHGHLIASIAILKNEPLDENQHRKLDDFAQAERVLYGQLGPRKPGEMDRLVTLAPRFDDLHAMAVDLVAEANRITDRQAALLQDTAISARRALILQVLAIVPLSLVLALVFSWMISRPVRQIGQAVQQLGQHNMDPCETVSGPRDLVELGERIDWLRQRLIELEEQKTLFLRHVSHELKTPLATLREGTELLADKVGGDLSSQQEEIITIMRGNVRDLQRMIEDLVGYSQVHRLPEQVAQDSIPLRKLIDLVISKQALIIRSKSLRVEPLVGEVRLIGDAGKLEVVFGNLLNNAIRFSPRGGRIEIGAVDEGSQSTILICDQGPGVAIAERASIFDPFFKGRVQPTDAVRGSGLGLAIAKEYVEAHGGQLSLIDSPPWGACFQVVLSNGSEVSS
jgi:two-component system sensor histidine kinase GlrK